MPALMPYNDKIISRDINLIEVGFRGTGKVDYPNCMRPLAGRLPFLEQIEQYIDYIHTRANAQVLQSTCLSN